MLTGKKILIGITGSIAAYKIPLLVRLLKKAGAEVKVITTPAAKNFVTPLTLSVLSGFPVLSEAFDTETGAWNSHVELGMWANLIVFAPVTANSLAKMATGAADNFLLSVYLSAKCPIMLAPAMDLDMYKHESTQENIHILTQRGHQFIAPQSGELASGLCGEGRMEEPEKIAVRIRDFFAKRNRFSGKNILITAGPTYEAIDPVRFIGNHSSGLMGIEIAHAFARQGANVSLVLGPTTIKIVHQAIDVIPVTSAKEMFDVTTALFPQTDIAILSAAVADFRPKEISKTKIKKQSSEFMTLELVKNEDILMALGNRKKTEQFLVGFSLETDHAIENAKKKLHTKNLDMIVVNSLEDQGAGFKHQTNKISIIDRSENISLYDLKSKKEVAADILDFIFQMSGK